MILQGVLAVELNGERRRQEGAADIGPSLLKANFA